MAVNTGANVEAAALPDVSNQGQSQTEQQVPVHVLQAMRQDYDQKLKAQQEQTEALKNHFQLMQWQQQQPKQQAPQNPFQGKDPKESILVEDALRLAGDMEARFNAKLNEIQLASRNAQYKEVINKFLPKAAERNPDILSKIQTASDPLEMAYLYATSSDAYLEDKMTNYRATLTPTLGAPSKPKVDPEAEKIIQNSKQSGNLASVSNNSSVGDGHPDFTRMSDADFRTYKSNLRFKASSKR